MSFVRCAISKYIGWGAIRALVERTHTPTVMLNSNNRHNCMARLRGYCGKRLILVFRMKTRRSNKQSHHSHTLIFNAWNSNMDHYTSFFCSRWSPLAILPPNNTEKIKSNNIPNRLHFYFVCITSEQMFTVKLSYDELLAKNSDSWAISRWRLKLSISLRFFRCKRVNWTSICKCVSAIPQQILHFNHRLHSTA